MPRKANTGWDFGELFPASAHRQVLSVSELTTKVKTLLEGNLGDVWVSGEITNLRLQSSGHMYFALKDMGAQLSCVLFRGTPAEHRASMKDGQKVTLRGEVTVYEPRGQYQMIVRTVELEGVGALQAAFERLKQKLAAEGLFDSERKRPIPRYPKRIGLVTSPTGAALRDVLHVIGRRFSGLELLLAPCRVQGKGAELEVAAALAALNAWSESQEEGERLDVILVTRGGGSLEDLWAFNEEPVARAIAASRVPVMTAIGHEIDFTIADFVADLRAATPSAAAELLTAAYVESREIVAQLADSMKRHVGREWRLATERAAGLAGRLSRAHPSRRLNERAQRVDEAADRLTAVLHARMESRTKDLAALAARLAVIRPMEQVARQRDRIASLARELASASERRLERARNRLETLELRLGLLSPERILARGYSITRDGGTGRVLRRAEDVVEGMTLRTRLSSGDVTSIAARADPGKPSGDGGPGAQIG